MSSNAKAAIGCDLPADLPVDLAQVLDRDQSTARQLTRVAEPAAAPRLHIAGVVSDLEVSWLSEPDVLYQVERSTDMQNWENLGDFIPGNGRALSILRNDPDVDREFFRVSAANPTGRQSIISVATQCDDLQVHNRDGFTVESIYQNPVTGVLETISLPVQSVTVNPNDNLLNIVVDGPVSDGARVLVDDGALTLGRGRVNRFGTVSLQGIPPAEAALWGKAYEPTDVNLFPIQTYPDASEAVGIPQSTDPNVIFADLNLQFQNMMDQGKLTPERAGQLLDIFWGAVNNQWPGIREIFTNPDNGEFSPNLLAAVLSLAGTPGENAIEAIIDAQNDLGRAPVVIFGNPLEGRFAESQILKDAQGQDLWVIRMNQGFREEPFQAAAAFIGHEVMHQDGEEINSQNEEIAAKSAEINIWKQFILANPELASLGTAATKFLNLEVLWHENSGATAFPNSGILEATHAQDPPNVNPNSNFVDPSLESILRNVIYPGEPDTDTPGNKYLDNYLSRIAHGEHNGRNFDEETVILLDDTGKAFTPEESHRILAILRLQPVFRTAEF